MPDDRLMPSKPGLDPAARLILGLQLRNYYESMRQTSVSESLAHLLRQFENGTAQDGEQAADTQTDAVPPSGS